MSQTVMENKDEDRSVSYTGPCVVIRWEEIEELEQLLINVPRPWNKDLRRRIAEARSRKES